MKKQTFTVTIEFSDKIQTDEDIHEIAKNIAFGLASTADSAGLAPDGSDGYTESITVTPQFLPEAKVVVAYDFNKGFIQK